MSLPVGTKESLELIDDRLQEALRAIRGLHDLLKDDGTVDEKDLVFIRRKAGLIGHVRQDLLDVPSRIEGS